MTQTSPSQKPKQYTLDLENEGRLSLPEEVLRRLDLKQGDRLILTVREDGTLHLVSLREQAKKVRGILKDKTPERSLVDELIQERREDAARE
jgi:bifunctional DNA-binding transcriptional regulator/antitoxin component of YhaV-PrlF toxin-antitoxin module